MFWHSTITFMPYRLCLENYNRTHSHFLFQFQTHVLRFKWFTVWPTPEIDIFPGLQRKDTKGSPERLHYRARVCVSVLNGLYGVNSPECLYIICGMQSVVVMGAAAVCDRAEHDQTEPRQLNNTTQPNTAFKKTRSFLTLSNGCFQNYQ